MSSPAEQRRQRFAELVLTGQMSQAECYRIAFSYKGLQKTAVERASRMMKDGKVTATLEQGRRLITEAVVMDQAALIRQWTDAATVDRNEIVEVRRICCRYCHGEGFDYQETPAEHKLRKAEHAVMVANMKGNGRWPEFDDRGGVGYDRRKDPHPDCPECSGFGVEMTLCKDTRRLSPAARSLYEGMDVKNGHLVVKVRERDGAEDKLARALGVLKPPDAPPGGGPTLNLFLSADMKSAVPDDPIEASRLYAKLLPGG